MAVVQLRPAPPLVLGREAPFQLGAIQIDPPTRRVSLGERARTLEPRVMQVLVLLARNAGQVVSRDELFDRCWEGRIVGEHAINRVIARLRAVSAELDHAFRIETVTKVGYCLTASPIKIASRESGASADPAMQEALAPTPSVATARIPTPGRKLSRRALVGGGLLIAAGAAGWWRWQSEGYKPTESALAFFRKGAEAQRQGLAEQNEQAVVHFRNAVSADPMFADAWGALALSYRHLLETRPAGNELEIARWSRSAAERGLMLDPDNADAEVALLLIRPHYGNWIVLERDYRAALRRRPDHWLLHANLGRLLLEVGRTRDAVGHFRRALALDAFLPGAWARLGAALWASGRLQEAENLQIEAMKRWPRHPGIWSSRLQFLLHEGRPDAAALLLADNEKRPVGLPSDALAAASAAVEAVRDPTEANVDRALIMAGKGPVELFVYLCCTLRRTDTAFDRLNAYYIDPIPTSLARRYTAFLFAPPSKPLWSDRRFEELTARIGLTDYWRATRSSPNLDQRS